MGTTKGRRGHRGKYVKAHRNYNKRKVSPTALHLAPRTRLMLQAQLLHRLRVVQHIAAKHHVQPLCANAVLRLVQVHTKMVPPRIAA